MFTETQIAPNIPLESQVFDSHQQLKNIERLLNHGIRGVELPISESVRDTLLIEVACLNVGLDSAGAEEAVLKVKQLVTSVRRLAGCND